MKFTIREMLWVMVLAAIVVRWTFLECKYAKVCNAWRETQQDIYNLQNKLTRYAELSHVHE